MRREAYTVGPRAELEHWKKRLAKFDSLTKSLKAPQCRTAVAILVAAKSKTLKVCSCHGNYLKKCLCTQCSNIVCRVRMSCYYIHKC